MAASPPPSDVCAKNTDEETNLTMETDQCSTTENGGNTGEQEIRKPEPEPTDTFKKPGFFAVPSLLPAGSKKRSNVNVAATASKSKSVPEENKVKAEGPESTGGEESSATVSEDKTTTEGEGQERDIQPIVKFKVAPKPRVQLPAKAPSVGKFPPVPYTEPAWGGVAPESLYALEILKSGAIVEEVPLTDKSYFVVGRLPVCDVSLEHPSISRYHAVVQYRGQAGEGGSAGEERGFYVHDLGSTHGTVVNKNKIPPKTFIRVRVGHVLKFGGSTRLFILQGPESDEEAESELTVTELREKARRQREELEKRMMGDGSDEDDDEEEKEKEEEAEGGSKKDKTSKDDSGCSWGMAEEAVVEEDENEENPFSTEFQEDQEAAYLKDPKKALQGFYDREGEELEFEYEDQSHGTWLCRIKLPVDDAKGRQLVAEVSHTGKKKDALVQCCLEACRMLEARGLLRQEAVSRKRKKKNWEDEDYYDSDDDTFLDRTGTVERKRQGRMKKAGKIDQRPDTYQSLVSKLSSVEKELLDTQDKLNTGRGGSAGPSGEDPLDAFMTAVRSQAEMDGVERRKLHVHAADLRKEAQRLRRLVELTRPVHMPSLLPSGSSEQEKPKRTLPLFGAMKGGSKFKLKTGTIGKLPLKRPDLPAELFNMKEMPAAGEEEEEEEEEEEKEEEEEEEKSTEMNAEREESRPSISQECTPSAQAQQTKEKCQEREGADGSGELSEQIPQRSNTKAQSSAESTAEEDREPALKPCPKKNRKKKVMGPSRPPVQLTGQYPEDDPDYCVWVPPSGQSGDGRTHLNDKFGY